MEVMMRNEPDPDAIAEEAVGQRRDRTPPHASNEKGAISLEETIQRNAISSGPEASISAKTAESVGERVDDAYSNPERISLPPDRRTRFSSHPFNDQSFLIVVACFTLGYLTAEWLHGRIRAYSKPAPFQITKSPLADQHQGGFVQSTVLKTITEHPQGMTTAEICSELGSQGIGHQSIANALNDLVQAQKLGWERTADKYHSNAAEVPTAPDQPSS
jgi:hypothetical protein